MTAEERTALPAHNLPKCEKAVTYGWQFSTMVVLPAKPSSRTFIVDQQRVKSDTTAIEVAFEQCKRIAPYLPKRSIVVLDRGYDSTWSWCRCSTLEIDMLGRLKKKRRFY